MEEDAAVPSALKKLGALVVKALQIVTGLRAGGLFPVQAGTLQVISKDLAHIRQVCDACS